MGQTAARGARCAAHEGGARDPRAGPGGGRRGAGQGGVSYGDGVSAGVGVHLLSARPSAARATSLERPVRAQNGWRALPPPPPRQLHDGSRFAAPKAL